MPPKKENQYIPKYIKDAPIWFTPDSDNSEQASDYLAHHRSSTKSVENNAEPRRGTGISDDFTLDLENDLKAIKRRKRGRCTNCGSMDHEKQDCLERPRSRRNDMTEPGKLHKGKRKETNDYDEKRDRWYGYDVNDYTSYLKKWETHNGEKDAENADETKAYDTDEEIELKELGLWEEYTSKKNIAIKKVEGEKTVRLREDKAVYLKDIKNDTIAYDPKSRTVRDDATGYFNDKDLFVRHLTGEAKKFEESKKFAWDEKKRGLVDDNNVANPTLADRKIKTGTALEEAKKEKFRKALLDRYNNDEENHDEREEADKGGDANIIISSKYDEDIFNKNHTSVWGSYYEDGKWGYRCCKSFDKDGLCK